MWDKTAIEETAEETGLIINKLQLLKEITDYRIHEKLYCDFKCYVAEISGHVEELKNTTKQKDDKTKRIMVFIKSSQEQITNVLEKIQLRDTARDNKTIQAVYAIKLSVIRKHFNNFNNKYFGKMYKKIPVKEDIYYIEFAEPGKIKKYTSSTIPISVIYIDIIKLCLSMLDDTYLICPAYYKKGALTDVQLCVSGKVKLC